MADREKVIKGLEILMNGCEYIDCDDCCFYISTKPTRCGLREEQIQEEAHALLKEQEHKDKMFHALEDDWKRLKELLKEQEAVEPTPPTDESDLWRCGNCNHQLFRCTHQRYCEMCGQAVKWE